MSDYVHGDKITQHGNGNIGKQVTYATTSDCVTDEEWQRIQAFVAAVATNLDALGLSRTDRRQAVVKAGEFERQLSQDSSQRTRTRDIAASIRTILEQAAGNLLAGALTGMWPAH